MLNASAILTHPGSSHKDEFLACAVLLAAASTPLPIARREPNPADLDDASLIVVDVGDSHDPTRLNFDHHQFPADHPPTCALSLVLQHLGLYEDAKAFCDWLEPAEWFDCRGPNATARHLGIERDILNRLYSPIDGTLLRRFASVRDLSPGDPLWEVMRWIGTDLLDYVRNLRDRLAFIADHAEVWDVADTHVLFLPRTEPLPEAPSDGIDRYIETALADRGITAIVSPDRRSSGYGLSRHRDATHFDFTRIGGETDVHFAHARGFVAKSSATTPERLRELLSLAQK
ncbi:MYG1 family protein [Actomonas aquatica]|uniref:MYG1 family protein n=1 Tax=Actomonas aquatica TaxID=2866162 RepID=A0ABZ1C5P4_9BACT|nr:MYG1 family protein [Opitutus sp. WL0086]WRQ85839.1 MYG1 family protein [Opitutus sp. WL0086]